MKIKLIIMLFVIIDFVESAAPDAPIVKVLNTAPTTITLEIKEGDYDGGLRLIGYNISWKYEFEGNGVIDFVFYDYKDENVEDNEIYIIENLWSNKQYRITVAAVNELYEAGQASAEEITRTLATRKPYAPPITSDSVSLEDTEYTLMWEEPPDSGLQIERYFIQYWEIDLDRPNEMVSDGNKSLPHPLSREVNEYTIVDLKTVTDYRLELWAENIMGAGDRTEFDFLTAGKTYTLTTQSTEGPPSTIERTITEDLSSTRPTDFAIRLADGPSSYEGRLEVYYGEEWGTVCNDGWGYSDARVVCRQLGYGYPLRWLIRYGYWGTYNQSIFFEDVACSGWESSLSSCSYSDIGVHDCFHSEDVALKCSPDSSSTRPTDFAIRLADGPSSYEGRLEVYYGEEWGTVCNDMWDIDDARVVCRQLGYGYPLRALINYKYSGAYNQSIFFEDVDCSGWESSFSSCSRSDIGVHDCFHAEDVALKCSRDSSSTGPTDFAIRLADGPSSYEGRLEVYYGEEWGTVCNDGWDNRDARVVCRQLGYGYPLRLLINYGYEGAYNQSIFFEDVACSGWESSLSSCSHSTIGVHDCFHFEDVALKCSPGNSRPTQDTPSSIFTDTTSTITADSSSITEFAIRLADGPSSYKGRLEVYYRRQWGTVCNDRWDYNDARVVCRELGYGSPVQTLIRYGYSGSYYQSIFLDEVECHGSESSLSSCSYSTIGAHDCGHYEDVALECSPDQNTQSPPSTTERTITDGFRVRLAGGFSNYVGRLEVYYRGRWGTVCDDGWDYNDARVVCRELGYGSPVRTLISYGYSGAYYQSIFLDEVDCSGWESSLSSCSHSTIGVHDCYHSEDVALQCSRASSSTRPTAFAIRLADGTSSYKGRLEVYYRRQWGTVCNDGWDYDDARVVCRELGYGNPVQTLIRYGYSGAYYQSIFLDEVDCTGSESSLSSCSYSTIGVHDCGHFEDVALECSPDQSTQRPPSTTERTMPEDFNVRLVDGPSGYEGRLEVYYRGRWGTVCNDGWGVADARVVCRELGYGSPVQSLIRYGYSGAYYQSIFLANVNCDGWESSLSSCSHSSIGDNNCFHYEDVALECSPDRSTQDPPTTTSSTNSTITTGKITQSPPSTTYTTISTITAGSLTTEFSIRLADGPSGHKGRLEVYYGGEWGTVCDDKWDDADSRVVCRQLGYNNGVGTRIINGYDGAYNQSIFLDNVHCSGWESSLSSCSHSAIGVHDCSHSEDVALECSSGSSLSGFAIAGVIVGSIVLGGILVCVFYRCCKKKTPLRSNTVASDAPVTNVLYQVQNNGYQPSLIFLSTPSTCTSAPPPSYNNVVNIPLVNNVPHPLETSPQAAFIPVQRPLNQGIDQTTCGGAEIHNNIPGCNVLYNPPPFKK